MQNLCRCAHAYARERRFLIYLQTSIGGCCHTSMEHGERASRYLQIYLRCLTKNVGDFPKNVGVFSENVGDFPENVGDFLWEVWSEGPEGRKVLQAQWRMRQSQCRAKG